MSQPTTLLLLWKIWIFCCSMSFKIQSSPANRGVLVSITPVTDCPVFRAQLPVIVKWGPFSSPCSALVDSGAEGNFIDATLVARWGIHTTPLKKKLIARALNGTILTQVTHVTSLVSLTVSGNHYEDILFYLLESPSTPIVLGHPWLVRHSPHIGWAENSVLAWSSFCHKFCLGVDSSAGFSFSLFQEEQTADLTGVPAEYLDFLRVFSKSRVASLPPHKPNDCAIDLLQGTFPPRGRLYSLSAPEREAMDKYIQESLAAGLIRSSSSPTGAGFFVEKKDGSLRPCTVKNRYPLPLMSSAPELMQGARIFTKLDLRNAYHLVQIRERDE